MRRFAVAGSEMRCGRSRIATLSAHGPGRLGGKKDSLVVRSVKEENESVLKIHPEESSPTRGRVRSLDSCSVDVSALEAVCERRQMKVPKADFGRVDFMAVDFVRMKCSLICMQISSCLARVTDDMYKFTRIIARY